MSDIWKVTFLSIVRKHVPSKKLKRLKSKLPSRTDREKQEIKLKHSLFRKFKKAGQQEDRRSSIPVPKKRSHSATWRAERQYFTPLFHSSLVVQPRPLAIGLCKINGGEFKTPHRSMGHLQMGPLRIRHHSCHDADANHHETKWTPHMHTFTTLIYLLLPVLRWTSTHRPPIRPLLTSRSTVTIST